MKGAITLLAVLVVVGLAFFLYSTPTAPPEMTEVERGQIEGEVMSWTDQWIESTRSLNADGAAALLDPDEARYVVNATFHSGWDECRNAFETLYSGWETWDPSWSGRSVEVLGPEIAFLIGQVRGPLTLTDGTEGINQVRLTFLLKKRADGWKATYGHGSGVFTPNPTDEG
jgi:ketosteroid isomerase-like protein